MSQPLQQLVQLLTLERLDDRLFRGQCKDDGLPQVFGGQVVAQALSAAMQVVPVERVLHSCHSYFLRAGDVAYPIIYETEILREGNSFTAVSVNAKQHNEVICRVMTSFQVSESGFEHQSVMPDVPLPESLVSENQLLQAIAPHLPPKLRESFAQPRPFEVRLKQVNDLFKGKVLPPEQTLWAKFNGNLTLDYRIQQCLLAYFSDFHCILTMLHPHQCGLLQAGLKIATLDHSIWFHRAFDFNQWLLFQLESPNAYGARGLTRGQVFDQQGRLVVSYQQEGLIRQSA